ncbi:MAG TPA: TA system VapC family ribonuclease toxin [Longimicrobiales bacterium]|nr:TA system VapC family ribonuclease toxin [Longimicrobiales bacterium]
MFVVDTNVLVFAANRDAPEHERCRRLLQEWRRSEGAWYLTWGIAYEFLRLVTHPRVLERPLTSAEALSFLKALLASPGLRILRPTDRHAALLEEVSHQVPLLAGNLFHDAHTATLMLEHGIRRIVTRDMDFHRFPFLETVDPLAPGS